MMRPTIEFETSQPSPLRSGANLSFPQRGLASLILSTACTSSADAVSRRTL
jgi:hypothetical protein